MCDDIAFDIWQWVTEQQLWISAAYIPESENVIASKNSRMFERSSAWKLTEGLFKQIVGTIGKPDTDLLASRINHQLSNYIYWRPDPGVKTVDAFSISWSTTYNYRFPTFSIILKVLQKIQQNKVQVIVVVPYWTTQSWFPVLLEMLVDHPLIMTASFNILYLPTHPTTPHSLYPKLKLLVAHISGKILSHKMFLQQCGIFSCPLGENQPGEDIIQCCNSSMISVGGNKPIICHQM